MSIVMIIILGAIIGGVLCGTIIAISSEAAYKTRNTYKQNFVLFKDEFEKKNNYRKYGII